LVNRVSSNNSKFTSVINSVNHESNEENPKTGCGPFGARTLFSGKLSQFCDSLNL